jgi:hypothetical protein
MAGVTNYSPYLPWYWFGVVAPLNVRFSSVFIHVAYKQYILLGSDAWKRLAWNAIILEHSFDD